MKCGSERLKKFLAGRLRAEQKLEFLFHLDFCAQCWYQVYQARKRQRQDSFSGADGEKVVAK